jgi:hypothetical protein
MENSFALLLPAVQVLSGDELNGLDVCRFAEVSQMLGSSGKAEFVGYILS